MRKLLIYFVIMLCLFGLTSCEKDRKAQKAVAEFLQRAEQTAKAKKEEAEKKAPIVAYVYEGNKLRDPFDRSETITVARRHNDSILPDVSLDDLQLVGTVVRTENSWAILRGTDGKLYHVVQGVYVGIQQAKVTEITQDTVVLKTEPEPGVNEKSQTIVMKIQERRNAT